MLPPAVSVSVSSPLWRTSTYSEAITEQVTDYRHNILADGGFWSSQFGLSGGLPAVEEWLIAGLGRHVDVRNGALDVAWEGFVNQVDATVGRLTFSIGPLLDVANVVDLVYSTVDTSGGGRPRVGVRANTGIAEHTASQERWGTRMKVLSSGGVNVDLAPQIRDLFLQENHEPPIQQRFENNTVSETKLTVQCLGYYHWLDYVYDQKVITGDRAASAKLVDILTGTDAATGNPYNLNSSWLTYGTTRVDLTNLTDVKAWEEKHKLAKELIDGIVAVGDASLNRWLFGIYENRWAYYHAAPTEVEYLQYLSHTAGTIFTPGHQEAYPWDIRPGKWMMFPDFMATRRHPESLREDPRAMFIESVDYTAPYTVAVSSGPTARLNQMLGQLGLAGVGA